MVFSVDSKLDFLSREELALSRPNKVKVIIDWTFLRLVCIRFEHIDFV